MEGLNPRNFGRKDRFNGNYVRYASQKSVNSVNTNPLPENMKPLTFPNSLYVDNGEWSPFQGPKSVDYRYAGPFEKMRRDNSTGVPFPTSFNPIDQNRPAKRRDKESAYLFGYERLNHPDHFSRFSRDPFYDSIWKPSGWGVSYQMPVGCCTPMRNVPSGMAPKKVYDDLRERPWAQIFSKAVEDFDAERLEPTT